MSDMTRIHFDNRDYFQDVSGKPFAFEFPQVEELEGHRFVHVFMGLYKAEPEFVADRKWMERMTEDHPGLIFRYEKESEEKGMDAREKPESCKILYAYNREAAGYIMDCCRLFDCYLYPELYPGTYPGYEQVEAAVNPIKLENSETFCGNIREGEKKPVEWGVMCYRWEPDGLIDKDYTGEYIRLAGRIGYLVEEGIYYFGPVKDMGHVFSAVPEIRVEDLTEFYEDSLPEDAVGIGCLMGWGPSSCVEVRYLTLNEKYHDRLKELCELLNLGEDAYFCFGKKVGDEELKRQKKHLEESQNIDMSTFEGLLESESENGGKSGCEAGLGSFFGAGAWDETETGGVFFEEMSDGAGMPKGAEMSDELGMPNGEQALNEAEKSDGAEAQDISLFELIFGNVGSTYVVPEGAEELLQGRGFENITLAYQKVSEEPHTYRSYRYAYKDGNDLVLVEDVLEGPRVERCDMQLLERLVVREKKVLNCNLWYPVMHEVIKPGRESK